MEKSYESIDQSACDTFTLEFRLGKFKKMYPMIQTGRKSFMIKNLGYVDKVKNACENATEYYNEYNSMYAREFPKSVEKTKNDFNFHYKKTIKKLVSRLEDMNGEFVEKRFSIDMTSCSSQFVKSLEDLDESPNSEIIREQKQKQYLKQKADKLNNSPLNKPVERQSNREIPTKNQQGADNSNELLETDLRTQVHDSSRFSLYLQESLDPISEHQSQENGSFFNDNSSFAEIENPSNGDRTEHSSYSKPIA